MNLSKETKEKILELQSKYPKKRSALIPALHLAQDEIGYLPQEIQKQVADLFEIDPNEVNAVVTFYDMFFEEPVGKHIIHVCKNVSCMLRGADGVISSLCQKVKANPQYTIIPSECLAACDKAPVMLIGTRIEGPVKEADLDRILSEVDHE